MAPAKRFHENPASNRVRTTSSWRAGPATIGLVDVLSDILKDFAPVWWVDPVLVRRPYDHNFGLWRNENELAIGADAHIAGQCPNSC
jgi:hypothetical protein